MFLRRKYNDYDTTLESFKNKKYLRLLTQQYKLRHLSAFLKLTSRIISLQLNYRYLWNFLLAKKSIVK